ncbi:MAG: hypothetical protein JEY97_16565 [Bacteroidales bacterium]|nr:hypothetical protein [Bacteroidales bacterium]
MFDIQFFQLIYNASYYIRFFDWDGIPCEDECTIINSIILPEGCHPFRIHLSKYFSLPI